MSLQPPVSLLLGGGLSGVSSWTVVPVPPFTGLQCKSCLSREPLRTVLCFLCCVRCMYLSYPRVSVGGRLSRVLSVSLSGTGPDGRTSWAPG